MEGVFYLCVLLEIFSKSALYLTDFPYPDLVRLPYLIGKSVLIETNRAGALSSVVATDGVGRLPPDCRPEDFAVKSQVEPNT